MKKHSVPKVTVISPYAGGDGLVYFLQSMRQQTLTNTLFELILVEDGNLNCSDELRLFDFGFRVTVIPFKRPIDFKGHSAGLCRNLGAQFALGTTLIFADSDCVLHPDCLRLHYEAMNNRENVALYGGLKELPAYNHDILESRFYNSYEEISQASLRDHRLQPYESEIPPTGEGWDFWYSGNASVSRQAFLQVGGFDKSGHRCHDLELAYRLFKSGVKFEYLPLAESIHVEHRRSMNFRKDQLRGLLYIGKKHPEIKGIIEDHFIMGQRAMEETASRCESKFQQFTNDLPGVRVGLSWITTPGVTTEQISSKLNYIPSYSVELKDNVRLNLRLHKNCWDYNLILPQSSTVENPLITVIIPVYNDAERISRAIQSVFLQTCQSFEIIIIDDASNDGTLRNIESYQGDPRFRVISLRRNYGLSNALNVGLESSQSPLILQLDADDWLEPNALETILEHFTRDDSVGAIYGDAIVHDQDGDISITEGRQLNSPIEFFEYTQCQAPRAFRKEVLINKCGWTLSDAYKGRYYEDRMILAKIAETHKVLWIPENIYHVEEHWDSSYRQEPLTSASAKLPILWEQANKKDYFLSYKFNGAILRGKFQPRSFVRPRFTWSVIIPFHRSSEQLKISLLSWLESDFLLTQGEIIVIDDGSEEDIENLVELNPERIKILQYKAHKGPAWARNIGASMAQYEMLFFSDADHIVPPDVISSHERRHGNCLEQSIVIGNVFGRRTFSIVEPDCRLEHKRRLLDILQFDSKFESIASMLACEQTVNLTTKSYRNMWQSAQNYSLTDTWLAVWATIIIKYGENLVDYPHRWTRVSSGSMSITSKVFNELGGFSEGLLSMEDWELGARAQKNGVGIICAPEAEPYHQIHPVDPDRLRNEQAGAYVLAAKHGDLIKNLLETSNNLRSPAAESIKARLRNKEAVHPHLFEKKEPVIPQHLANGYCVLTFDDGPDPLGTQMFLEVLERFNCKGTFFFLGKEAAKHKEICRQVADAGHEIGVHGWIHTPAERYTTIEHFEMLSKAVDAIEDAVGASVRYTRPPYGHLSSSYAAVAAKLGLQVVGWEVSSEDYSAPTHIDIIRNLAAEGIKNKVLLFHDGAGDAFRTVKALEWLLKTSADFGIRLISLSECAQFRELPALEITGVIN